jgi:hypothetical protein
MVFAIFLVIIASASANSPPKGLTSRFIFEKNGLPYNDSVNYTISCSMSPSFKPPYLSIITPGTEDIDPWSYVFKLSGTCPSGNCLISKISYYHTRNYRLEIETEQPSFVCELNGSSGHVSFTTWNETGLSGFHCNRLKGYYDTYVVINSTGGYYNYTPEYLDCNRNVMQSINYSKYSCEDYLANSSIDRSKGNWTQLQCAEIYNREIPQCYQYLKEVDLSWSGYEPKICEYRFNLSSENEPSENVPPSQYIPQKPVESLYCNILKLFGTQC